MTQESILVSLRIQACLKHGALPPRFRPAPASDIAKVRHAVPSGPLAAFVNPIFAPHPYRKTRSLALGIFCGFGDLSVTCNLQRNNVLGDLIPLGVCVPPSEHSKTHSGPIVPCLYREPNFFSSAPIPIQTTFNLNPKP
jgi:hypothetical protein